MYVDADATIGTPGDALPAKRGKRGSTTLPGNKSAFSLTPFLSRTSSVPPVTPASDGNALEEDIVDSIEMDATPSASPKKSSKKLAPTKKSKPLLPATTKNNTLGKPARARKSATAPTLENVAEEELSENEENTVPPDTAAVKEHTPLAVTVKTKLAPLRKSLAVNFDDDPAPEKRKKRKVLGGGNGLGKTLFDEDDAPALKPMPGKGALVGRPLGTGVLLGKVSGRPSFLSTEDGFAFSPLKRDKKGAR